MVNYHILQHVITSFFVLTPGTISNNFIYLGGLKKCVTQKFSSKSLPLPLTISLTGIPEVLEVISVPFSLFFSIKSKTVFFISIFSTTTSIIQSAFFIFFISSFKFPSSIFGRTNPDLAAYQIYIW